MRFPVVFLILISICLPQMAAVVPRTLPEAVNTLDLKLLSKAEGVKAHMARADSIRRSMKGASAHRVLLSLEQLGDIYRSLDIDSSLMYYNQGIALADSLGDAATFRLKLHSSSIMPVRGLMHEALETFQSIPFDTITGSNNKATYFEAANRLCLYAVAYYTIDSLKSKFQRMAEVYTDSLVRYLAAGSPEHMFYTAQTQHSRGNPLQARAGMREVMSTVDFSDRLYARAASELASIIAESHDYNPDEHLYYLILAALADIEAGTREAVALMSAGVEMYRRGDITRAYRYLTESEQDALLSNSKIRTLQVAEAVPIISRAYEANMRKTNNRLWWLAAGLLGAIVLVSVIVTLLLRERSRSKMLRSRMADALSLKDRYIPNLMSLCSVYIERLEDFNRLAGRKIKGGQVTELYNMIESGKIIQEQTKKFHEQFDLTFSELYPDFATEVNKLLADDRKLPISSDKRMTPELRMLAFIRLGITDGHELSRFLGLSINTVYAYRNKLRNRAEDRENFEKNVMEIGRIE